MLVRLTIPPLPHVKGPKAGAGDRIRTCIPLSRMLVGSLRWARSVRYKRLELFARTLSESSGQPARRNAWSEWRESNSRYSCTRNKCPASRRHSGLWWAVVESNHFLSLFRGSLNDHTSSLPIENWLRARGVEPRCLQLMRMEWKPFHSPAERMTGIEPADSSLAS